MIVSAFIVFSGHISEISNGKVIGIVIVISSFLSMMYAVFASRPSTIEAKRKHKREVLPKYPNLEENLFAVGALPKTKLEDYEKAYNEVVQSQELQIGNQIRTSFILEGIIHQSYKKLRVAYEIFITGFVLIVLIFIITELTILL